MPPAYPLFREALAGRNLHQSLRLARQLPTVALPDAARLLELLATDEMGDADMFDRAAVRWIQRLTTEVKGITLSHVTLAVNALDQLDESDAALDTLIRLCATSH